MCSSKVRVTDANGGGELAAHCGSLHADVATGPVDILLGAEDSITVTVPNDTNVVTDEVSSGVFEIANAPESAAPITVNNEGNVTNVAPGAETVCCEAGCGSFDGDTDGRADVCDCNPADPMAFGLPEVTHQGWTNSTTLQWDQMAPQAGIGTTYQVVRGVLSELPVGAGAGEVCIVPGTANTTATDATLPGPGQGFYYLVRVSNSCGRGTFGVDSGGQTRVSNSCQ
jgi:hypothetical protein